MSKRTIYVVTRLDIEGNDIDNDRVLINLVQEQKTDVEIDLNEKEVKILSQEVEDIFYDDPPGYGHY